MTHTRLLYAATAAMALASALALALPWADSVQPFCASLLANAWGGAAHAASVCKAPGARLTATESAPAAQGWALLPRDC
jgi:hypothetical protein